MSIRVEFENHLALAQAQTAEIKDQIAGLDKAKDDAIAKGDAEKAKALNKEAVSLREKLEDSMITVKACEARLRTYKQNEPEVAKIREHITGELWAQGLKAYSKLQQGLDDVSAAMKEIDSVNGAMYRGAMEIPKLIGDSLHVVPAFPLPNQLRDVMGVRSILSSLPETLELKLHSAEIQEGRQRLEEALNEKLSKQKAQILPFLSSANMQWPQCSRCREDMECLGGQVYDGSKREPAFGDGPELQSKAFRLQFACQVGPHNGPQGFVRVEAGAFHVLPLRDLEIER